MRFELPPEFRRALLRFMLGATIVAGGCAVAVSLLWNVSSLRLFEYLDVPLHLFGGLGAAVLIVIVSYGFEAVRFDGLRLPMRLVVIFGGVALIAAGWELAEALSDKFLGTGLHISMAETIHDFALSLAGAVLVAWKLGTPSFLPKGSARN